MPILERLAQPSQARHWTDSIPLEFHYTAGVAGEEFRRELRDNGRFLVSKCSKCKSTYIPARMYCPSCFIEMKDQFRSTSQVMSTASLLSIETDQALTLTRR